MLEFRNRFGRVLGIALGIPVRRSLSLNLCMTLVFQPRSKKSTLLSVCPYILANEFCERLAAVGLSVNLVNYLVRKMHLEPSEAAIQVSVWMGVCYTTPMLGAYLADSVLGRYKTILLFSSIYVLGLTLLSTTALAPSLSPAPSENPTPLQNLLLYGSLYTVALGTGGIKPCVAAFGADQFDESHPQDCREKESFFNWFYFTINLGSLMGSIGVVYVQERLSLGWGLAIPASAMLFAVLFFVLGSPLYRHVVPAGSPIVRVFQVVVMAVRNRLSGQNGARAAEKTSADDPLTASLLSQGERLGVYVDPDVDLEPPMPQAFHSNSAVYRSKSLKWLDAAANEADALVDHPALDSATSHKGFSPQQVEEVKLVLRMLPVWLTTMGYWAVFSQMMTTFVEQGQMLDTKVQLPNGGEIQIPAASMFSVDTIAIVLLIPVYDAVVEPVIRRVLGKKLTLLQKIGCGLVLAICAMLSASLVEQRRLARQHTNPSRGLSILWQIPQFALVGVSEVFGSVGQLEFFYDQAPDVMRSFALAMQLSSVAMGNYLAGLLVVAARALSAALGSDWLPKDLNSGRLDLFFLFIAGALALNFLVFIWVAISYEYKLVPHAHCHLDGLQQPSASDSQSATPGTVHSFLSASQPSSAPALSPNTTQDEERASDDQQQFSHTLARMPESPPQLAPLR